MREMDPGAVEREAEIGRRLAWDDAVRGYFYVKCIGQSYDKALSYTLFAFVRAGNIEDAVKLCRGAQ